jgi:hypothetical protein
MQFVVSKVTTITSSIAIDTDTPEAADAAVRKGEGNVINFDTNERYSVRPRPQPGQAGQAGSQQSGGVQSSTTVTPSQPA